MINPLVVDRLRTVFERLNQKGYLPPLTEEARQAIDDIRRRRTNLTDALKSGRDDNGRTFDEISSEWPVKRK